MEPPPDGGGNERRALREVSLDSTFNEAAAGWRRKHHALHGRQSIDGPFNGAAAGWRRKQFKYTQRKPRLIHLQWSRRRMAAETTPVRKDCERLAHLQWSRRRMAAETLRAINSPPFRWA